MKKGFLILGVALALGLALAACDNSDGVDAPKNITITGFATESNGKSVVLQLKKDDGTLVAQGDGKVMGGSVRLPLKAANASGVVTTTAPDWTGTGVYVVGLTIGGTSYTYIGGPPPTYNTYNVDWKEKIIELGMFVGPAN